MVNERIAKLRQVMKAHGVDAYMVPTDDYHCSEYVGEFFKCRKYITGFTGSAGTAVITQDMAGLWTDGRYFIQAERQMADNEVKLFKMGEPGVPTVEEFLENLLTEGQCLGFDGKTVAAHTGERIVKKMEKKGVKVSCGEDLIGLIWEDRPALSCEPVWELDLCWSGKSRADKIAQIRGLLKEAEGDIFLLTSLEDICWLFNIRGNDIHTCPVVLSYLIMTQDQLLLYANEKAFPAEVKEHLAADGVEILPYGDVYEKVKEFEGQKTVILDKDKVNYLLSSNLPADVKVDDRRNLTLLPKAIKNPVEVANERIAHIKDGAAVTKFIYWLKKNVGKIPMTELSATEKLYELRSEQEHFLGNSFDPIISYGEHAAMNHYSATPETDIPIEPHGLLLADTGGHYLEGTTDTTRTTVVGPLTEDERLHFTLVLRGMLNLGAAKFRYGSNGQTLDYAARQPLWERGEDFNHGTGHGVGYYLSVHEGPNGFRWRELAGKHEMAVLEEGMITSDEPGYYVEGGYGIRHENMMVCKKAEKNSFGQFMCFEFLTMAPFDLDGVIPEEMTKRERELLNAYHRTVYENLLPYMNDEEKIWLKEATRAI